MKNALGMSAAVKWSDKRLSEYLGQGKIEAIADRVVLSILSPTPDQFDICGDDGLVKWSGASLNRLATAVNRRLDQVLKKRRRYRMLSQQRVVVVTHPARNLQSQIARYISSSAELRSSDVLALASGVYRLSEPELQNKCHVIRFSVSGEIGQVHLVAQTYHLMGGFQDLCLTKTFRDIVSNSPLKEVRICFHGCMMHDLSCIPGGLRLTQSYADRLAQSVGGKIVQVQNVTKSAANGPRYVLATATRRAEVVFLSQRASGVVATL